MIDTKILSSAIDLVTGRLRYHFIDSSEDILALKVDRVVSSEMEIPCYLVGEVVSDGVLSEKWEKNGQEVCDENELTNNKIILPMSQWDEEV